MDIMTVTNDYMIKMEESKKKLKEQTKIVENLGKQLAEQSAILRAIRLEVQAFDKGLAELKGIGSCVPLDNCQNTISISAESDDEKLKILLGMGADKAIENGIIVDTVVTKQGFTQSVRESVINRAYNCISRDSKMAESVFEHFMNMSDEEIIRLRNAGRKTCSVIKYAKDIATKLE